MSIMVTNYGGVPFQILYVMSKYTKL